MREIRQASLGGLLFDPGPEEQELIDRHYDEWLAVGFSTKPSDRERAEAALREAYRLAQIPIPPIEWVGSPAAFFDRLYDVSRVRDADLPLRGPIWRFLNGAERVPTPIWPLWTLGLAMRLTSSVETGFRDPVWLAASAYGTHVPPMGILGQTEAPRLAYARFFEEVGVNHGGRRSRRLALREEIARACGWAWAREDRCLVSDRPAELRMESAEFGMLRIHRADGPAVVFRDGFQVWAWRGVSVERRVVEDQDSLTAEEVRTEPDPRVRAALLDRMGLLRYLEEAGAEVVGEIAAAAADVPAGLRGARLLCAPWDDEEPLVALVLLDRVAGRDGAPLRHAIRVPPTVASAREAAAWTFGLEAEEYAPEVEA